MRAYDLTRDVPSFIAGAVYVPYTVNATQEDGEIPSEMTLVVRTLSDTQRVAAGLRRLVFEMSRDVTVSDVKSMEGYLSDAMAAPTATTSLFIGFAALALVLGSVGVYGVLSFLVSRRTREIGVRVALGARASDILWLIMKEGAKVCATPASSSASPGRSRFRARSRASSRRQPCGSADVCVRRARRSDRQLLRLLHAHAPSHPRRPTGDAARPVIRNAGSPPDTLNRSGNGNVGVTRSS